MPVRVSLKLPDFEDYLRQLQQAGVDIDQAALIAVENAAPLVENEIRTQARKHRLTGATEESISASAPQSFGNFHFVQITAGVDNESASLQDEYGTTHMAPIPFFRPGIRAASARWRAAIKSNLNASMGVDFG